MTELQQLDIFSAIAQAEAEAVTRIEEWQPGDYLQGINLGGLEKAGFFLRESQSGLVVVGDGDGNPLSLLRSETVKRACPPTPELIEAIAPQPEPAPEPGDKWQGFKVGDRIVYTITLPNREGKETRTLRGIIEGFEDKYWTAPVALVRVHPAGPLYPCGLRAVSLDEEGDRDD